MQGKVSDERNFNRMITVVSIVIPVVVALLFGIKIPNVAPLSFLPPIYAAINGLTAVLLLVAVWAIKNGNQKLHQNLMTVNIVLSLLFFGDVYCIPYDFRFHSIWCDGLISYVYYFILITHIILSIALIPLVLRTYAKAYLKKFEEHRSLPDIRFLFGCMLQ
ncbi:DUF420 domain-containing protein [Maribacter confluentis]|uniref:DUF420 domain-containing protein n=1 Tax=Maribacter confluentis TaxID=1656093 RepID=A0ABT8RWK7_9FLAO|nr:DUF420 domain-containing protein [Maribacter confluentis]MDO1514842.1 DUF420 domain-containing protein [Maribacter confluentis]